MSSNFCSISDEIFAKRKAQHRMFVVSDRTSSDENVDFKS